MCGAAQGDGELIDCLQVDFSDDQLGEAMSRQLAFWSGQVPPAPVAEPEQWKCTFCYFRTQCPTGIDVARQQSR